MLRTSAAVEFLLNVVTIIFIRQGSGAHGKIIFVRQRMSPFFFSILSQVLGTGYDCLYAGLEDS